MWTGNMWGGPKKPKPTTKNGGIYLMVPVALDVGWLKVPYPIGMDQRPQLKKNTLTRAISFEKKTIPIQS